MKKYGSSEESVGGAHANIVLPLQPKYMAPNIKWKIGYLGTHWKQLTLTSTGSKVKHTSPDKIYELKVSLPPLDTQKK